MKQILFVLAVLVSPTMAGDKSPFADGRCLIAVVLALGSYFVVHKHVDDSRVAVALERIADKVASEETK